MDHSDSPKAPLISGHELVEYRGSHLGKRLLHILILVLPIYFVLELIAKSLTVAQLLFVVWKKRPHPVMRRWGASIADYMQSLWRYCTFASDAVPWPFKPRSRSKAVDPNSDLGADRIPDKHHDLAG